MQQTITTYILFHIYQGLVRTKAYTKHAAVTLIMIDLWPVINCSFKGRVGTNCLTSATFFATANHYVPVAQHHIMTKEMKVFKVNGINNRYIG